MWNDLCETRCALLNNIQDAWGDHRRHRFSSSSSPQPAKAGSTSSQSCLLKLSPTYFREPISRHNHFHQELCLSTFYRFQTEAQRSRGVSCSSTSSAGRAGTALGTNGDNLSQGCHCTWNSCHATCPILLPTFPSPGYPDPETFVLFPENDWSRVNDFYNKLLPTSDCQEGSVLTP